MTMTWSLAESFLWHYDHTRNLPALPNKVKQTRFKHNRTGNSKLGAAMWSAVRESQFPESTVTLHSQEAQHAARSSFVEFIIYFWD